MFFWLKGKGFSPSSLSMFYTLFVSVACIIQISYKKIGLIQYTHQEFGLIEECGSVMESFLLYKGNMNT